tara:strand:- start:638 stop:1111 length:474 start_codon:yes stop_codon:yes gene_type:complete
MSADYSQNIAMVNNEGTVVQVNVNNGSFGEDGTSLNGLTVRRIPDPMVGSRVNWIESKWHDGTEWQDLPTKPNVHASLNGTEWTWDSARLLVEIRQSRLNKLLQCDWAILPDSPLSDENKTLVQTYRTALRDLPAGLDMSTIDNISDVTWPTPPACL